MTFLSFVWDPSKGIDLGFFTIRYYSLMFVVAFLLGYYLMKKIGSKDRLKDEELESIFIYTVLATLIGARLGHFLFYDRHVFIEDPLSIILPFSFNPKFEFTGFQGLASHGAAIGIILSTIYISKKKKVNRSILWLLDRIVIPVSVGAFFVRLGNFFNSEIVGKYTGTNYGVIYPARGEHLPRYPTQLYEGGGYILVFLILWWVYWKTNLREKPGFLFGLFLVLLWAVRFIVEFWKIEQATGRNEWVINTGQALSIPFVILGFYFMFRALKKGKEENLEIE